MVFHILNGGGGHGLQGGISFKQGRRNLIDSGIGTLSGEPDGNHQFIILSVVKGAHGVRIPVP